MFVITVYPYMIRMSGLSAAVTNWESQTYWTLAWRDSREYPTLSNECP
jgi:hypothetical protein